MAIFPKVQRPCPVKNQLASFLDGDICRLCKREVHDITAWSDQQRVAFLEACDGEVCVSYRLPAAAAMIAAAALTAPNAATAQALPPPDIEVEYIIVGGITDPKAVEYVDAGRPSEISAPDLPVVYSDDDRSPPAPAGGNKAR